MGGHIADAEPLFMVVNITPDFCKVNKTIVPFDIAQILPPEKASYSPNVRARGDKVLAFGSVVAGVKGNAGKGVLSTVSQSSGHSMMTEGDDKVFVNGSPACRHGDRCLMNVKVG